MPRRWVECQKWTALAGTWQATFLVRAVANGPHSQLCRDNCTIRVLLYCWVLIIVIPPSTMVYPEFSACLWNFTDYSKYFTHCLTAYNSYNFIKVKFFIHINNYLYNKNYNIYLKTSVWTIGVKTRPVGGGGHGWSRGRGRGTVQVCHYRDTFALAFRWWRRQSLQCTHTHHHVSAKHITVINIVFCT